jgi:hypothetical protein
MFENLKKGLSGFILGVTLMVGNSVAANNAPQPSALTNKTEVAIFVRKACWNKEISDVGQFINETIDATKNHFSTTAAPSVDFPTPDDWRTAKQVEVFWYAAKMFNDFDISDRFRGEVNELLAQAAKKNFTLAKYLIMSQCSKWQEGDTLTCELQKGYSKEAVADGVAKLLSAINGDKDAATALANKLKENQGFKAFFPMGESTLKAVLERKATHIKTPPQ